MKIVGTGYLGYMLDDFDICNNVAVLENAQPKAH